MAWLGMLLGTAMVIVVLIDTFEAVVLPRRIAHRYRISRIFVQSTWLFWRATANWLAVGPWRSGFLSVFGPISLLGMLCVWAAGLIAGFAIFHWSADTQLSEPQTSFITYLYFSGTTFFTLGYGDLVPVGTFGRLISAAEAGIGFGFLAVVISYLPVLYQAFSRREISISLLDARAGSPPTSGELLRRLGAAKSLTSVGPLLQEWERWSAELLESHLSYPALRFYRSQHDNQSWVGALTVMLDTSALLIAVVENRETYQARLTFAMARHAAVDLSLVAQMAPVASKDERLSNESFARLLASLCEVGLTVREGPAATHALAELRALYEPFVNALAEHLLLTVPPFQFEDSPVDNWQKSPWMTRSPGLSSLPTAQATDDHFG